MEFVAAALDKPRLYRYADPLGALNVAAMRADLRHQKSHLLRLESELASRPLGNS